jgi:hypothetical protein
MYSKGKTLGEKYKETYELRRERNTMTRNDMRTKLLLNRLKWTIKAESTTFDGTDEIKRKVRLTVWNDTEDYTKGINGYKMDMVDKRKLENGPRNNNTGLDKIENNVHQGSERVQHTIRNKLKEDFHIT